MQKPTVGRIVHYIHPGSADGKWPIGVISPAIIQKVHSDTCLDLWVFASTGFYISRSIEMEIEPEGSSERKGSSWCWPPIV